MIAEFDVGQDKPNITITKQVGCGQIFCIFVEHNNGNFDHLLIRGSIAKKTPCAESWLWGVSRLLTYSLRRAFKESGDSMEIGIIKQLFFHECSVLSLKTEKSCISAIGRAVQDYIRRKNETVKKES